MHAQATDAGNMTTTMKCISTFPQLPILYVTSSIIKIIAQVGRRALSSKGGDHRNHKTDTGLSPQA
jgi:hypothetical protein